MLLWTLHTIFFYLFSRNSAKTEPNNSLECVIEEEEWFATQEYIVLV